MVYTCTIPFGHGVCLSFFIASKINKTPLKCNVTNHGNALKTYTRHKQVDGMETIILACTILLNANRAGSMDKRTWLGVQGTSEATIQSVKLLNCALACWTRSICIQQYSQRCQFSRFLWKLSRFFFNSEKFLYICACSTAGGNAFCVSRCHTNSRVPW